MEVIARVTVKHAQSARKYFGSMHGRAAWVRTHASGCREVHNHHEFAWREHHMGADARVIRKGYTPAFPGQEGFVGATMGEPSVILRGTDSADGAALLHSTADRAGRVMSRTKAAGRMGRRSLHAAASSCAAARTARRRRRTGASTRCSGRTGTSRPR